jgi:hypothetical protein
MALHIANTCSETINVALLLYDPGCTLGGQPWRKVAWYVIAPGQTIIPNVLNVDLRTVNGWAGLYAYTASGDKDWQGTGNAWFAVSEGVHFNQCGEDETNCPKWVDFEPILFGGNANIITYVGPAARQINSVAPSIAVTPGEGAFFISGSGFVPGSTINVIYNYFPSYGGVTTNSGAPAVPSVNSSGGFTDIVSVSTLFYTGQLDVQATDNVFSELSATVSVPVT